MDWYLNILHGIIVILSRITVIFLFYHFIKIQKLILSHISTISVISNNIEQTEKPNTTFYINKVVAENNQTEMFLYECSF